MFLVPKYLQTQGVWKPKYHGLFFLILLMEEILHQLIESVSHYL